MSRHRLKKVSDYEVGWGRPPVQTRWKPGRSGNPKGRPAGRKNLDTLFYEALTQTLEVRQGGKVRKMSAMEGIVHRIVAAALSGDFKAASFLMSKEPEITRTREPLPKITQDMSVHEAAALYARLVQGE